MRQTIAKCLYLLLIDLIGMYLIAYPVYAFQISSSSTGYVRVATSSAIATYQVAQRASFVTAVASAVTAPTAASVALRLATGPVGWGLLGVSAALTLANMYYTAQEIQTLKTAALAAQPTNWTVNSAQIAGATNISDGCSTLTINCVQTYQTLRGTDFNTCPGGGQAAITSPNTPTGWTPQNTSWSTACYNNYRYTYNGSNGANKGGLVGPTTLTTQQAQDYVNSLPAVNPNSIESNTVPLGQGETAPSADNVTTLQVSPTEVVPTVKPASQVQPTDAVIDPNAPPPTGPQPVTTPSTTTTTTTTTTTNPDGSTTTQQTDDPSVMSCSIGNHDQRTFGSVLQDHMNLWAGSGLAGALNLIKNLTWPESIPTYALSSNTFGNFTLDFSGWSGVLLALRGLVIAIASFVAYRIIFVGSK